MTADALQTLMQHRHHGTTLRYINLARQLNPTVQKVVRAESFRKDHQDGLSFFASGVNCCRQWAQSLLLRNSLAIPVRIVYGMLAV
jgi:hypothetical protein